MNNVHGINLVWLIRLRWGNVLGQLITVLVVTQLMNVDLPVVPLIQIILFEALTNLAAIALLRRRSVISEQWIAGIMGIDVLVLTALLHLTGGPFNPFSTLYLVDIALAAVVLSSGWTWTLTFFSLACFGSLFILSDASVGSLHMHSHVRGMWVAFAIAALFIVYFVQRIRRALVQRDLDLARVKDRSIRTERLASLTTLAAGAAHELATPLSTIALVSKELEKQIPGELRNVERWTDDVRLIRSEVKRCQTILNRMAEQSGEAQGEKLQGMTCNELVERLLATFADRAKIQHVFESGSREAKVFVPPDAFVRVLAGVVKNGLQASSSDSTVEVRVRTGDDKVHFRVSDRGSGMSAEVLTRAGEPFFTTKEPGQGMGLGLFLTRAMTERLGGDLKIESESLKGTTVTLGIPVYVKK